MFFCRSNPFFWSTSESCIRLANGYFIPLKRCSFSNLPTVECTPIMSAIGLWQSFTLPFWLGLRLTCHERRPHPSVQSEILPWPVPLKTMAGKIQLINSPFRSSISEPEAA